uniref:Uncharacterized protein n=1 Tax=Anguilla anguilla TaxID=7936 RepID=A0A0E9XYU4_ANGAN
MEYVLIHQQIFQFQTALSNSPVSNNCTIEHLTGDKIHFVQSVLHFHKMLSM